MSIIRADLRGGWQPRVPWSGGTHRDSSALPLPCPSWADPRPYFHCSGQCRQLQKHIPCPQRWGWEMATVVGTEPWARDRDTWPGSCASSAPSLPTPSYQGWPYSCTRGVMIAPGLNCGSMWGLTQQWAGLTAAGWLQHSTWGQEQNVDGTTYLSSHAPSAPSTHSRHLPTCLCLQ